MRVADVRIAAGGPTKQDPRPRGWQTSFGEERKTWNPCSVFLTDASRLDTFRLLPVGGPLGLIVLAIATTSSAQTPRRLWNTELVEAKSGGGKNELTQKEVEGAWSEPSRSLAG